MKKLMVVCLLGAAIAAGQDSGDFEVTVRKAAAEARAFGGKGLARMGRFEFKGLVAGTCTVCTEAGLAEKRAKGAEAVIWREGVSEESAWNQGPRSGWDIKNQTKRMTTRADGSYCADVDVDATGVLAGRIRVGEATEVRGQGPARPVR